MSDLSNTTYFKLLTELLTSLDQAKDLEAVDKEEGIIEWTVGNLILRLFPHAFGKEEPLEPNTVIVEADLMLLDLENKKVNHDRFLILHQLNSVSLLTTGIVAFIDEEGMLSIGKVIPLTGLDVEELSNEIGQVIKAAEDLYVGWNQLTELSELHQKKNDEEEQETPSSLNQMA